MWLLGGGALLLLILAMSGRGRRASAAPSPATPSPATPSVSPPPPPPRVPPPPPIPGGGNHDGGSIIGPSIERSDATTEEEYPELLAELRRASPAILGAYQTRDPNVVNGRPGSGLNGAELENAIAEASQEGLPAIVHSLQRTLEIRAAEHMVVPASAENAPGELSFDEPSEDAQIQARVERQRRGPRTPLSAPEELPRATASRAELQRLAIAIADNLRRSGHRAYDRELMKSFQRGAGLTPDGDYGQRTKQALGYYGRLRAGAVPPAQY